MQTLLKFTKILFGFVVFYSLSSCTDVIDIDLEGASPKLVIEASIDWQESTSGADQTIKLSMTTPVFDQQEVPVTGASVSISNDLTSDVFVFADQSNGNYTTNSFVPVLNQSYTLTVIYNGEIFTAQETLQSLTNMVNVSQSTNKFDKDELEVNVEFSDPTNEENYYLIKFQEQSDLLPSFTVITDENIDGNSIVISQERAEDEDINQRNYQAGDVVQVALFGISKRYYEYFDLLDSQLNAGRNPFGSVPVGIKGNITNQTNAEKNAFGYFRLTSVYRKSFTFN